MLPADINLHMAISTVQVQAATSDPKFEPDMGRGVVVDVDLLVLEAFRESRERTGLYNFAERQSLKLQEDIRVQANALGVHHPHDDVALGKASFTQMRVRPVTATAFKPARMQSPVPESSHPDGYAFQSWELKNRSHLISPPTRKRTDAKTSGENESRLVDDLLFVPHLAVRATMISPREDSDGDGDQGIVTFEVPRPVAMHVELRQIYSLLIVVSLFRHLASFAARPRTKAQAPESERNDQQPKRPLRAEVTVNLHALHLHLVLAKVAPLFIEVDRLEIQPQGEKAALVEWDLFRVYGRSVPHRGKWDDILGAKTCSLRIVCGPESRGAAPLALHVVGDVLRSRIPFKFVFAEIFDSIGTFVKACKQLAHQFVKGGMGSVLQPVAEPPKHLPEINLKFRILVIQAEDDPFETKLNAIWRAGCEELNDRQAREEAFLSKVAELEVQEGERLSDVESDSSTQSDSGRSGTSASFDAAAAVHEARQRLEAHNATAWTKRIRNATAQQTRQEEIIMRQLYGHIITNKIDGLPIDVVPLSKLTPLARLVITQVEVSITKPSFPPDKLPDFLHDVGRGMPKDTEYTLLIPLHLEWRMLGATVRLRDFPLFLFHLPRPSETPTEPVWEAKTDLVIAEELAGHESIRLADAEIVGKQYAREGRPYVIRAVRTTNPVKTYALPHVRVNAPGPVRFGWGNSMQPAIQDLVRCIDALTKPPADPSPRIGFWDKIRLIMHWRVTIHFEGDSDVVVHLKGSRDPYQVLGAGAGYAKVWRGDVRFLIGHDNPDHEVWQITSRDYVLGIPNLKEYVDSAAAGSVSTQDRPEDPQDDSSSSLPWSGHTNRSRLTEFLKVTAKLSNGVRWGMGLKLERTCRDGCAKCDDHGHSTFHRECRFFDFVPHYEVVLRGPDVVIQRDGKVRPSRDR